MATVSLYLDKRYEKKNGTYPLKMIVYSDGRNVPYSFENKISLTEIQFEKLCSKKLKDERLLEIRKYTNIEIGRAQEIIKSIGNDFSFELFESFYLDNKKIKKGRKDKIYSLFEEYIAGLTADKRYGTAEAYSKSMGSFKKFSPVLPLSDITPAFFERYENWFLNQGFSISTLQGYIYCIRTIINIAKDKKFISEKNYPFGLKSKKKYEIPQAGKINRGLTLEEVRKIIEYDCEDAADEFSRDIWLFSFYCNGMNMADIFSLKYKDMQDSFFSFHRAKTIRTRKNKIPIEVCITEDISNIIEKWGVKDKNDDHYVFGIYNPSMSAEERFKERKKVVGRINRHTKKIGKELGVSLKITSYAARNSWATIISDEVGVSIREVSDGLGHSTLNMTQRYLDSFPKESKKVTANKLSSLLKLGI